MKNLKEKVTQYCPYIESYEVINDKYVIKCSSWYRYTIFTYAKETTPYIDETKSFLIDLFSIYKCIQKSGWNSIPLLFFRELTDNQFNDDFTLLMKKNTESPYPRIVLNPVSFLMCFD